jgi:putative endonuclease
MAGYIYVLASRRRGTLYVGVTNDLVRRVHEHRSGLSEGFSGRYCVKNFVYLATYDDMRTAIQREKNIKHWARKWKITMIERDNPDWIDLFAAIAAE